MTSVSIFFPAGDFSDVLRRYEAGKEQVYQAHNEVARLIHDLVAADCTVTAYSFITPEARVDSPLKGCQVVSLGAKDYSSDLLLQQALAADRSDAQIIHFPNAKMTRAAAAKPARLFVILASSFNRRGLRSVLQRRKIVSALNDPRVELVANHCLPATRHLARLGVNPTKLIAWDFTHPFEPGSYQPKSLNPRPRFEAVYAGSIVPDKGIADLIRAVALLRRQGIELHCALAGQGDIEAMKSLAAELNVSDLITFVYLVGNSEVFEMMRNADVVVVPSRSQYPEGFPLVMFEAIASRTPIVCSDHPMFRDIMVDGRNAAVFAAGDAVAFAAALRKTLTDAKLYSTLSINAERTWEALKGPADWRTMILKWVTEGKQSPWLQNYMSKSVKSYEPPWLLAARNP